VPKGLTQAGADNPDVRHAWRSLPCYPYSLPSKGVACVDQLGCPLASLFLVATIHAEALGTVSAIGGVLEKLVQ